MSTATSINISALTPSPKPIQESVTIGKDILDLLTSSMYVDPMNVYREYIQNAADAIDQARDAGLSFDEPAGVQIFFGDERSIRIRDNGISIPFSEFVQRIITIGASQKKGKQLRGFRGVGRLSGLGYCQELIFRGRAEGQPKVTEIRWNGRALKEKYRDQNYTGSLTDIIKEVTTVTLLSPQGFPNRFFEVEMRKVSRLKNDILLNEEVVRKYLAQVAPVSYRDLSITKDIQSKLEAYGIRPPINIELMDGQGPIEHRLVDKIVHSDQSKDTINKLDFFELKGTEGEVAAFGWIADMSYLGSIPKSLGLGGIRLRSGNIQVGDDTIAAHLFTEQRFSGWAIGEVHVLSPKILPNGRRDEFEPSVSYTKLQDELALKAREIAQRIRDNSGNRNKQRTVSQKISTVKSWVTINSDIELPPIIRSILRGLSEEQFFQAKKELSKLDPLDAETIRIGDTLMHVETEAKAVLNNTHAMQTGKSISESMKRPIEAALKTIITTAKTPEAGVKLSMEILSVMENEM
jgi:hypothetical protein